MAAYTQLTEVLADIRGELDNQVSEALCIQWINREINSICAKREWNFFLKTTTAMLGVVDATTGESILPLPSDMKKVARIYTKDTAITDDAEHMLETEFEQSKHYRLEWYVTGGYYRAIFTGINNTTTLSMSIEYWSNHVDLVLSTSISTQIPERFANVIILAVLRRAYRKLGDIQQAILSDRQFKEELESMKDDDAREHDLPKMLLPDRGQSREEYQDYLNEQKSGDAPYYNRFM